jgi:hypothetical protein
MIVLIIQLKVFRMMLLHMLIQVGDARECVSAKLAVCPTLMRLLVVDQGRLATVCIIAGGAEVLASRQLALLLMVPVVA